METNHTTYLIPSDTVINNNANPSNESRYVCIGISLLLLVLNAKLLIDPESPFYLIIQLFAYGSIGVASLVLARETLYGLSRMNRVQRVAVLMVIGLVTISVLRAYLAETLDAFELFAFTYEYLFVLFFIIGSYSYLSRRNMVNEFLDASANSLFLYVAANFIFYAVGAVTKQPATGHDYEAVMLSLIGIDIDRVQFPLATGINNFGSIAGVALVFSIMLWFDNRKTRYLLFSLLSLTGILMVDNRGGLLVPIVVVGTILFWGRLRKMAVIVPFAIPFVYLLLATVMLSTDIGAFADIFARNKTDVQTLGNRGIVWLQVLDEISTFKPVHLLGYGMYGQQTSEVSYGYLNIFTEYLTDKPERISLHSGYLQYLIDYGYIGLFLIVLFNSVLMWRIASDSNQRYSKIILCVLLCMFLIGISEPVPTVYSRELFYVYFMLFVAGLGMGEQKKANFDKGLQA